MAKSTLAAIASASDLQAAVIAQIVIDGWSLVSGAAGVYQTAADALGRRLFIKPSVDTVGNLMFGVSPVLNDAGDDLHSQFTIHKGTNFIAGTWHLYGSDHSFFLVQDASSSANTTRFWCGRVEIFPEVSLLSVPWSGFVVGVRRLNSTTAYWARALGYGQAEMSGATTHKTGWTYISISFIGQYNGSATVIGWYPNTGWLDGKLVCMRPIMTLMQSASAPEGRGNIGICPDVICCSKNIDLVPGDTITLENGEKYEFREHTLYWDEYLEFFLLWRMN